MLHSLFCTVWNPTSFRIHLRIVSDYHIILCSECKSYDTSCLIHHIARPSNPVARKTQYCLLIHTHHLVIHQRRSIQDYSPVLYSSLSFYNWIEYEMDSICIHVGCCQSIHRYIEPWQKDQNRNQWCHLLFSSVIDRGWYRWSICSYHCDSWSPGSIGQYHCGWCLEYTHRLYLYGNCRSIVKIYNSEYFISNHGSW